MRGDGGDRGRLLVELPAAGAEEHFEDLLRRPGIRIERIVSHGQASPADFWYDQDEDEWVLVVAGEAVIELEGPAEVVTLQRGDWLMIPARRRHRVLFTESPTVWLAVWLGAAG